MSSYVTWVPCFSIAQLIPDSAACLGQGLQGSIEVCEDADVVAATQLQNTQTFPKSRAVELSCHLKTLQAAESFTLLHVHVWPWAAQDVHVMTMSQREEHP